MLREVTCFQATVTSMDFAYDQIDTAIAAALSHSKPVLIQVGVLFQHQDTQKSKDGNSTRGWMQGCMGIWVKAH